MAGLSAIALALAAGPLVVARSLPRAGEAPSLPAPDAREATELSLAAREHAARPIARTRPPRLQAPATLSDDAEPLAGGSDRGDAPPETEGEFYERFLATWRAGGEARRRLEERAPAVLRAPGSTARKVALLRALRDAGSPAGPDLLELTLRELPDVSGPRGVSVPAFVVSHLGRADRISDAERAVLERAVHRGPGTLAPSTRGRALRVLVDAADAGGRLALGSVIETESHPLVRAMGEQALRSPRDRKDFTDE